MQDNFICIRPVRVSRLGTSVGTALDAGGVDPGGGARTHGHADLHLGARAQGDTRGQRGVLRERLTRANILHPFLSSVLIFIFTIVLSFIFITVFAIVFAIVSRTAYLGCSEV